MRKILFAAACLVASVQSHAQLQNQPPSPEQMKAIMAATMEPMIPFMGKMMEVMTVTQLDVMSRPESAESMAKYVRNFYNELIKTGFSKEEALKIATSVSMPMASPQTK